MEYGARTGGEALPLRVAFPVNKRNILKMCAGTCPEMVDLLVSQGIFIENYAINNAMHAGFYKTAAKLRDQKRYFFTLGIIVLLIFNVIILVILSRF